MIWIGLTGPLACGKSTVASLLQNKPGCAVIDADQLVHELLMQHSSLLKNIKAHFGLEVFDFWPVKEPWEQTPVLNRKRLAQMVFPDPKKKTLLESLIHPLVQEHVLQKKDIAKVRGTKYLFYDVPLLFEKEMETSFDFVLLVACHLETQKQRAWQRAGMTVEDLEQRLAHQKPLPEKILKSHYIIWNDFQDLKTLENEVSQFYHWMIRKYQL
ncbi:MAG: dephospho-CoA kinase [Bdellovibrionaceae bacterium]|nr:dephospho-CoA kinase [Pseudobdellovibrionaceae bacterium]MDW8190059.1 dephospho-CoA kinase [Pseudobdellovibrionaceae bacterium]